MRGSGRAVPRNLECVARGGAAHELNGVRRRGAVDHAETHGAAHWKSRVRPYANPRGATGNRPGVQPLEVEPNRERRPGIAPQIDRLKRGQTIEHARRKGLDSVIGKPDGLQIMETVENPERQFRDAIIT